MLKLFCSTAKGRQQLIARRARVAELVDAHGLGPCVFIDVWVQVPPLAHMFYLFLFFLFISLLFFILPSLSSVPYFPSNHKDAEPIIDSLASTKPHIMVDLGAGDGWVLFKAATQMKEQSLSTRFIAVEINPLLCAILYVRRLFHPNRKNIQIIRTDLFTFHIGQYVSQKENVCIYVYISPWMLKQAIQNIRSQIPKARIVSYMYPLNEKAKRVAVGIHKTYTY